MGTTPRTRLTQLPLPARSTECSTECFGRLILSYLREDKAIPASFFQLGTILHEAIEYAVNHNASLDFMARSWWTTSQFRYPEGPILETTSRSYESMFDDYQRMIAQWFRTVHPDGEKRHPIYDQYEWPPKVETRFDRSGSDTDTQYGIWGSADADFTPLKSGPHLIVDWKSATKRIDDYFQLDFYRYGLQATKARAAYHMLDRVQNRSIINEAPKYQGDNKIRERILNLERQKDRVLKGLLPGFKPDWYCDYCPQADVCPVGGDSRNNVDNLEELKRLIPMVEPLREIAGG